MDHDPARPSLPPLPAPPPFAERRRTFRRSEDRGVHEERSLLARALDVLAGPGDAATQAAEILGVVARVVGARRAALLTDRPARRVLVAVAPGEDAGDARELAAWLDARAERPAAIRAAAPAADVVVVRTTRGRPGVAKAARADIPLAARLLRLDMAGMDLHLGLELVDPADGPAVAGRLPADTLRHLVAALAAASGRAAVDAERTLLRARERERERFVSTIVHELRTPLTGLGGYLDLLADGAVDDREIAREFIERGRDIVERMASLVGDLLEMSKIEAGSLSLEIEAVSVAEACQRALDALAPIAAQRAVRLAADLPPRIRTVRADLRRVEQIVTNLAGNACKFAPEGGLVEVSARVDGPVAIVVVRDDGPGIAPAERELVFRPFARLGRHQQVAGTGLGLSITRDLARAMGGDVVLVSVEGSGASFVLGLPAAADVARAEVSAAIAAAGDREELALEERAILQALRTTGSGRMRRPGAASERGADGAAGVTESAVDAV